MTRAVALALVIACLGLLAYDSQLVLARFEANGGHSLSLWKIAAAAVIQAVSLAYAAWYALFLVRRNRSSAQSASIASLRIKLLPFVVPVVLSMASVALLEIGLFCGDQAFPSVRGRSVCPNL